MASFRNKLMSVLDVALRVPPVFVVDSLFMNGIGGPTSKLFHKHLYGTQPVLSSSIDQDFDDASSTDHVDIVSSTNPNSSIFDQIFSSNENEANNVFEGGTAASSMGDIKMQTIFVMLNIYSLMAAVIIFSLSTRQLFSFYLWIVSMALIIWSYLSNDSYIHYVNSIQNSSLTYELFSFKTTPLSRFTGNYFLQVILSLLFCFLSTPRQNILSKRLVGTFFIIPTILSLLPGTHPSESLFSGDGTGDLVESNYMRTRRLLLTLSPLLATAIALVYVVISVLTEMKHVLMQMYRDVEWARTIVRHYGVYTLIENQWSRLHVPQVLRVFWLTRLVEQALVMTIESGKSDSIVIPVAETVDGHSFDFSDNLLRFTSIILSFPSQLPSFNHEAILVACKELLVRGCETVIAVLGMTSVISSISHEIGSGIQWFLSSEAPEDRGIGTVSAILFFILALQTGITGMEPEKRFQRLYRNVCLLFTAILHFIHNIVSPQLFSLSASRNMSLSKHVRSLTVCLILILLPAYFMAALWQSNPISTWLLAVSAFSIEVIIKVIISLLIYGLFMMDAYRTTMWEPLDDYVYYIKSFGSTVEFVFGIFLFFNGAWILLFESGGTIRALMMCIHAYFNIWMQAKQGWQKFMRRRLAVHKINSLPEATKQQLEEFDDVCAICYQELQSARITRCKHYFHGVCLRKWLYVQDICPLCHETLTADTESGQEADAASGNQEAPANGGAPVIPVPRQNDQNGQQVPRRRLSEQQNCPVHDQGQSSANGSMASSSPAKSFHSTSSAKMQPSTSQEGEKNGRVSEEKSDQGAMAQRNEASFVARRTSRRLVREQGIDVSDIETMSTHSNQSSSTTAQSSVSTVRFVHDHRD